MKIFNENKYKYINFFLNLYYSTLYSIVTKILTAKKNADLLFELQKLCMFFIY